MSGTVMRFQQGIVSFARFVATDGRTKVEWRVSAAMDERRGAVVGFAHIETMTVEIPPEPQP